MSDSRAADAGRYTRQTRLAGWGNAGQKKLSEARVLVVGAGGLGCPALQYLAAAGLGFIRIADADTVSLDNLQRQILYGESDVGFPKAERAAKHLLAQNSGIRCEAVCERFDAGTAERLLDGVTLVLDCSDNLSTRFSLHDLCYEKGIALVQGAVYTWEGQLQVFRFDLSKGQGCWRCLWDEAPDDDCVDSCAEVGIAGAVTGTLGALQANAAIRILLGLPVQGTGTLTTLDLQTLSTSHMKWKPRGDCPLCGKTAKPAQPRPVDAPASVMEIKLAPGSDGRFDSSSGILDIRESWEISAENYEAFSHPERILCLPLSELNGLSAREVEDRIMVSFANLPRDPDVSRRPNAPQTANPASSGLTVLVICAKGFRSRQLVQKLNAAPDLRATYLSVTGGVFAYAMAEEPR